MNEDCAIDPMLMAKRRSVIGAADQMANENIALLLMPLIANPSSERSGKWTKNTFLKLKQQSRTLMEFAV